MGAGHPEGPPQPGQWKIALKLKPKIEDKAKANQGTRTDLSMDSPKGYPPTDTRKEMAKAVGIGEQTMGRITQLAENVPKSLKDVLENKELSINRGWRVSKAVQRLPPEERESAAAEISRLCEKSTRWMPKQIIDTKLWFCSVRHTNGPFC